MTHTTKSAISNDVEGGQTILTVTDYADREATFRVQREVYSPPTGNQPRVVVEAHGQAVLRGADLGILRDLLNGLPESAFVDSIVWTDGDSVQNTDGVKVRTRINGEWRWAGSGTVSATSSDDVITQNVRHGYVTILLNQHQASVTA